MNVIGYIRVSTDTQAMEKQRHLLLEYAQRHQLHIAELINVEVSSRRDTKERRIDALPARYNCVANFATDSVDLYGGDLCKPIRRNLRCDCMSAVAVIVPDAGPTENLRSPLSSMPSWSRAGATPWPACACVEQAAMV